MLTGSSPGGGLQPQSVGKTTQPAARGPGGSWNPGNIIWNDDNFLVQVLDRPTRSEALLGLLLTNAVEITEGVKVGGSLGCSDHALVKFVILRNVGLAKRVVRTLNFGKANFICWPRSPGTLSLETKMLRKADYVSRMPISEHKRSPSF